MVKAVASSHLGRMLQVSGQDTVRYRSAEEFLPKFRYLLGTCETAVAVHMHYLATSTTAGRSCAIQFGTWRPLRATLTLTWP